jgi:hypothetical protein
MLLVCGFSVGLGIFSSQAKACGTVQLDRSGGPMSYIPVHNQKDLGICYAETAAQLVDAFRFSHGDRQFDRLTSGMQAAFSLGDEMKRNKVDGGKVCPVIRHLEAAGSCDQRAVLSFYRIKASPKQFTEILAFEYQRYHRYIQENGLKGDTDTASNFYNEFDTRSYKKTQLVKETTFRIQKFLTKAGFPRSAIPSFREIHLNLEQDRVLKFIEGVLSPSCKQLPKRNTAASQQMPKCNEMRVVHEGPKKLIDVIHAELSAPNPQPVAISYCAGVLKQGESYRGLVYLRKGAQCAGESRGNGLHASLVIGRRKNPRTGSCEFRIRNSWGPSCGSRKKPKYSKDWDCDHGNIWVSQDALMNSIYEISYLQ